MEQKLGSSSEVVVSIIGIEQDHKNTHVSSSSAQTSKSSSDATPSMLSKHASVEPVSEDSLLPTHPSSLGMASPICKTNNKTKKGNVWTTVKIEGVPYEEVNNEDEDDDEEEEEVDDGAVYDTKKLKHKHKTGDHWEAMRMIEFTLCSCIVAVFITSLAVTKLRHVTFLGLEIWRWWVLLFILFCGRLWTAGFTNVLVFLIERNWVLKKVLYFVHSLKRSVQVFFWLALILLTWVILIRKRLKEPKQTTVVLRHVTRFLLASVFGAGLWVVKTLLVKILACSFHVKRFFDRIQDCIFRQFVLLTLSKPPMEKTQRLDPKIKLMLIFQKLLKGIIIEKQTVDIDKLGKMIKTTVSAWTISGLINVIEGSELATISGTLDGTGSVDITNEEDAKRAGNLVFKNVANVKGCNSGYIEEANLKEFLKEEDVEKVFDMFKCSAESKKINRRAMKNWVVKAYKERELLAQSLKDAKTAVENMDIILSGIALIVIIVVWLVLMRLATTQMLVFLSSQLLVATFIFGNSCRLGFECIIYIFVMHPYDVGDNCIIDEVQKTSKEKQTNKPLVSLNYTKMTVEVINILTTVFKSGKETIVYPNSSLSIKPISNFYRTPVSSESVEFVIDVLTSDDTIAKLKSKIQAYIHEMDKHWNPNHQIKQIKHDNKLKMVLYVNPVTKFQDYGESSNRKPELLSELKKIFEELEIKYYYLPQEVHISNVGSDSH